MKHRDVELFEPDLLLADCAVGSEIVNNKTNKRVSVFGGAGIIPGSPYYEAARCFTKSIAQTGVSVMTGGGIGIMEAANRGVYEANTEKAISYGIRVKSIICETQNNCYLHKKYEFETLVLRLLSLITSCDVAVLFPGGFGTLEEMFAILVRIRIGMLQKIPVYLFGKNFWNGLIEWINKTLVDNKLIDQQDTKSFVVLDDVTELIEQVCVHITALG